MKIKFLFYLICILLIGLFSCEYEYFSQGKRIYEAHCQNCHMDDGSGLKQLIPDITHSPYLVGSHQDLICLIRNGIASDREDGLQMNGNEKLNDIEICNLVNYLQNKYSSNFIELKITEVEKIERKCTEIRPINGSE